MGRECYAGLRRQDRIRAKPTRQRLPGLLRRGRFRRRRVDLFAGHASARRRGEEIGSEMPAADWLTRNGRYVAAGFLVLGLAVRLRRFLAAPSYWDDEAYILVNIFDKSFAELAGPLRCDQAAPPFFLWLLRALYQTLGGSEWAMRLPAFLASIVSMPLMIPLARRFAGSPGWIWAVALVAGSQTAAFPTTNAKPQSGDLLAVSPAFP